eukprot:768452-Hanusia_phi.AAC.5
MAVKFKNHETGVGCFARFTLPCNHVSAVAEALGLNGSIMPGDGEQVPRQSSLLFLTAAAGLPGDNFMIGVKRGAQLANFNVHE